MNKEERLKAMRLAALDMGAHCEHHDKTDVGCEACQTACLEAFVKDRIGRIGRLIA